MSGSERAGAQAPAQRLVRQIVSGWRTQALHAAVELELPERLAAGPRTPSELAGLRGDDVDGLTRLLRALCVLGVCRTRRDGRFVLTRAGRLLCADGGGEGTSLRPLVQWWGGPLWPVWGALAYSVRTGRSARERLTGTEGYAHLERDAAQARVFHEAMRSMTALIVDDVVHWPGWHGAATAVDVGGGHGQLLLAVLGAHAGLRGEVLDLPSARAGTRAAIDAAGLQARARFRPGSFFDAVPAGADRYLLKSILHNWDDARCITLLQRCRAAMRQDARLLVVERVRPQRLRRSDEGLVRTDLNMLAGLGGRERSLDEFATLLGATGFAVAALRPTAFEFSLIEAVPTA